MSRPQIVTSSLPTYKPFKQIAVLMKNGTRCVPNYPVLESMEKRTHRVRFCPGVIIDG